jgi:hypothetical protein
MIYTDGTHLVSISADELHAFAKKIGLQRRWYQEKRIPHYDLTTDRKVRKAMKAGAILVDARELVNLFKDTE